MKKCYKKVTAAIERLQKYRADKNIKRVGAKIEWVYKFNLSGQSRRPNYKLLIHGLQLYESIFTSKTRRIYQSY